MNIVVLLLSCAEESFLDAAVESCIRQRTCTRRGWPCGRMGCRRAAARWCLAQGAPSSGAGHRGTPHRKCAGYSPARHTYSTRQSRPHQQANGHAVMPLTEDTMQQQCSCSPRSKLAQMCTLKGTPAAQLVHIQVLAAELLFTQYPRHQVPSHVLRGKANACELRPCNTLSGVHKNGRHLRAEMQMPSDGPTDMSAWQWPGATRT